MLVESFTEISDSSNFADGRVCARLCTLPLWHPPPRAEMPEVEVDFENQVKGYRYGQVRNGINVMPLQCGTEVDGGILYFWPPRFLIGGAPRFFFFLFASAAHLLSSPYLSSTLAFRNSDPGSHS